MRLKTWVKWLIGFMVLVDITLIVIYLYMLRLIEIGG